MRFRCDRFPEGEVPIRTAAGLVVFHDGRADVVDEDLAQALREVPAVFQISEEGGSPAEPKRPANNASTEKWAEYARALGATEEDIEGLSRADLIELYGG